MSTLGKKLPHSAEWRRKVSFARMGKKYPNASLAVKGDKNPAWCGDKAKRTSGNKRAQRMFAIDRDCERCGAKVGLVRHHKNDDTLDNRRENIEILCRSCHMKHHNEKRIK